MFKIKIFYRSFDPYYSSIEKDFYGSNEYDCWNVVDMFENELMSKLPGGVLNNYYVTEVISKEYL